MADTIDIRGHVLSEPEAVARTALATLRRHAAAPLTGTLPFWERLVQEVLATRVALSDGAGVAPDVETVADRAAGAFAGSPVTNSPILWRDIVGTVLAEHDSPSGLGDRIPAFLPHARGTGSSYGAVSGR